MNGNHLQLVQIFRGLAALMVVLRHSWLTSETKFSHDYLGGVFQFGYSGVDFFFVLSGFIITYSHVHEIGKTNRVSTYLKKRLFRIFVPYWPVALAMALFYSITDSFGFDYFSNPIYLLKSFLLWPQSVNPVLNVAWTLTHELWFYIIFGLALAWGKKGALCLVALFTTLSLYQMVSLTSQLFPAFSFPMSFVFSHHNLEFLMGCGIAFLSASRFKQFANFFLFIGFCSFVSSAYFENQLQRIFGPAHSVMTYGLASGFLLIGAIFYEQYRPIIKSPRYLLFFGNASYSIYLIHFPALSLLARLSLKFELQKFVHIELLITGMALIATTIACLYYILWENRMLLWFRRRSTSA